ncbi:antibiotic biosynthesis monooxygenase [Paenibacillus sp. 1011MAR3C5]|uniref:antibiotic biosynthesis monooxygenase family protein n=1 Tax=Paenibacillus sp. 1011MAR3C5 TaxID=1675787 RepID=UPI000E6BAE0E|nr:antibiotic biosynthesis monooxygenase [Paenibacillus sp. 1011MAR3C5]RJE90137.1 antibiotic biosynthesis monooxygenase [Paenibacillus sp. 1011MAR3C5]
MDSAHQHEGSSSYYAVIFTSTRTEGDNGYGRMADRMVELAARQPGYIGVDSVRDASGTGITVSYWESLEAIRNWKANEAHLIAQEKGKQDWYKHYSVKICKVEREYGSVEG